MENIKVNNAVKGMGIFAAGLILVLAVDFCGVLDAGSVLGVCIKAVGIVAAIIMSVGTGIMVSGDKYRAAKRLNITLLVVGVLAIVPYVAFAMGLRNMYWSLGAEAMLLIWLIIEILLVVYVLRDSEGENKKLQYFYVIGGSLVIIAVAITVLVPVQEGMIRLALVLGSGVLFAVAKIAVVRALMHLHEIN